MIGDWRSTRWLPALVVTSLLGGFGCPAATPPPAAAGVVTGFSFLNRSGDFGAAGGHYPGAFFRMVLLPGKKPQFAYLMLFKRDIAVSGFNGESQAEMETVWERRVLDLGNRKLLKLFHELKLDRSKGATRSEVFTIDEVPVDLARGRLFLVDLAQPKQPWRQLALDLPDAPDPWAKERDTDAALAVRAVLEPALSDLAAKSADVKGFLER
jgi:hypothetical protein